MVAGLVRKTDSRAKSSSANTVVVTVDGGTKIILTRPWYEPGIDSASHYCTKQ